MERKQRKWNRRKEKKEKNRKKGGWIEDRMNKKKHKEERTEDRKDTIYGKGKQCLNSELRQTQVYVLDN